MPVPVDVHQLWSGGGASPNTRHFGYFAFRLEPGAVDVRFEFGRVLYHAGKLPEAGKVLEGALPSNECRLHNLLARVFSIQGKTSEAEREVKALGNCRGETGPRTERP